MAGLSGQQAQDAAPGAKIGIQDAPGSSTAPAGLGERLDTIDRLGVDVVRFTLHWNEIEPRRRAGTAGGRRTPSCAASDARDPAGRDARRLAGVGERREAPRFAPQRAEEFAVFATAAARRYPFVRRWTIWNEPNLRR